MLCRTLLDGPGVYCQSYCQASATVGQLQWAVYVAHLWQYRQELQHAGQRNVRRLPAEAGPEPVHHAGMPAAIPCRTVRPLVGRQMQGQSRERQAQLRADGG
jgi:hypothetical protein